MCELQHDCKHKVELKAMSAHTIHMSDCASAFMINRPTVAQQALQTLSGGVLTVSVCTVHNSVHASGLSDVMARSSTYACCIATQQPSGSCSCCSLQHDSAHLTCLLACSSGLPNRALLNKWPAGGDAVSGPPGADGLLLSLAKAMSQVLPTLPAPASPLAALDALQTCLLIR